MPDLRRLPLLLCLALCLALAVAVPAGGLLAAVPRAAAEQIGKARADLERGDGIAAEVRLKEAQANGAAREDLAALMGEAMLAQGSLRKARDWLEPGEFSADTAALGFRNLGRLERIEGHLDAAATAYDAALKLAPRDAMLWVDIARMRYAAGQHLLAIAAADRALALGADHPRALELKGQIVRDQFGMAAALPWFERGLQVVPADLSLLGEYAATLGDAGRARAMLAVTRKMLDIDPGNPRAYFLQAVLAARAGKYDVARALMYRTKGKLDEMPAAMLLQGAVELATGNPDVAATVLDRLVRRQPANARARVLLARALDVAGEHKYLIDRFGAAAGRLDATPYFLTLVARAHEAIGQRDQAAPLLDRAAFAAPPFVTPVYEGSPLGGLLGAGRTAQADAIAQRDLAAHPGNADVAARAGDVQLALGRGGQAQALYESVLPVRFNESLMLRMVEALSRVERGGDAVALTERYLAQDPSSRAAIRLAAGLAAQAGDWKRATAMLDHLRRTGGAGDARLLADLAFTTLRAGNADAAAEVAQAAWRVQPANPTVAQAWGMALTASGANDPLARALLDKAQRIGGDNPLLAEGRKALAARRKP